MLDAILLGAGFAFAAALQPGPLQAFLLSRVVAHGWKRTLPAALSPVLSDGPIALLVLIVLQAVPAGFQRGLRVLGGIFLLALAWSAFREARREEPRVEGPHGSPRTLFEAVVVNLLNPNPYLGWAFVLGPATLGAWAHAPGEAIALVAAFYATMVLSLAGFIAACGGTRLLGRRVQRALMLASALALAALGMWQLARAF